MKQDKFKIGDKVEWDGLLGVTQTGIVVKRSYDLFHTNYLIKKTKSITDGYVVMGEEDLRKAGGGNI